MNSTYTILVVFFPGSEVDGILFDIFTAVGQKYQQPCVFSGDGVPATLDNPQTVLSTLFTEQTFYGRKYSSVDTEVGGISREPGTLLLTETRRVFQLRCFDSVRTEMVPMSWH